MTNHGVLHCATWMAAAIGLDREFRSVQPGLPVDLIAIDGDPLKDIRQSENVMYTMVNDRLFDAKMLNRIEPTRIQLPKGPNLDGLLGVDMSTSSVDE